MSIESTRRFGFPIETDNEHAIAHFDKLRSFVATWFDGKEAINANANLSAEGRATALRELGEKTLADLDAFTAKEHGPIYHVGARLQDLRTRARGHDPKAATDAVTELRDERIRTHLRSLDELARLNAVKTAIENGDVATFRAVLHDPLASLEPMFGEEATAELKSSWLRKHDDSLLGEKIDLMRDLHEAMEVATRETRNGLAEAAGLDATLRDRIGAETA